MTGSHRRSTLAWFLLSFASLLDGQGQRETAINSYVRDYLPLRSAPQPDYHVSTNGRDEPGDLIGRRRQFCAQNSWHGSSTFGEIIALDPTVGHVWPGNLVQGKSLATGQLQDIVENRAPIKVTLSKVVKNNTGHRQDEPLYSRTMNTPSFDEFQNRVLHELVENPSAIQSTTSYQQLLSEEVHTLQQAGMKLGLNVSYLNNSFSTTLEQNSRHERNTMLVKYVQVYYSFSVAQPGPPASVFARNVKVDGEFRRQISKSADPMQNNPALYIESVDYGRVMVLSMSSAYSEERMDRAFRAALSAWTVSASATLDEQTSEVVRNSYLDAVVIGGFGGAGARLLSAVPGPEGPRQIAEWIEKGASYSPTTSPGAPISYKVRYLADGGPAGAYYETDWTQRDCRSEQIPLQAVGFKFHVGKDNSKHERMQAVFRVYVNRGAGNQLWAEAFPGSGTKWEEHSEHPDGNDGASQDGYFVADLSHRQVTAVSLEDCPNMHFFAGEQDPRNQGNTTGWNTTLSIALKFENQWHIIKEFASDGNEFLWGDASPLGRSHMTDTVPVTCPGGSNR